MIIIDDNFTRMSLENRDIDINATYSFTFVNDFDTYSEIYYVQPIYKDEREVIFDLSVATASFIRTDLEYYYLKDDNDELIEAGKIRIKK